MKVAECAGLKSFCLQLRISKIHFKHCSRQYFLANLFTTRINTSLFFSLSWRILRHLWSEFFFAFFGFFLWIFNIWVPCQSSPMHPLSNFYPMTEAVRKHPLPPCDVTVTSLEKMRVSPHNQESVLWSGLPRPALTHTPSKLPSGGFPIPRKKIVVAVVKGLCHGMGRHLSYVPPVFPLFFTLSAGLGDFYIQPEALASHWSEDLQIVGRQVYLEQANNFLSLFLVILILFFVMRD